MPYWRSAILAFGLGIAAPTQAHDPRCNSSIDLVQPRRGVVSNAQIAGAVALVYLIPIYAAPPSIASYRYALRCMTKFGLLTECFRRDRSAAPPRYSFASETGLFCGLSTRSS